MRKQVRDERQAELFDLREPSLALVKRTRKSHLEPKDESAVASAPEVKADEIAARITPLELGDLVHALSDEKLAYLVTAATRDLKRRLARGGFQRRSRLAKGRASDLERFRTRSPRRSVTARAGSEPGGGPHRGSEHSRSPRRPRSVPRSQRMLDPSFLSADSDGSRPPVPTRSRPAFRFDVGHHSGMKPASR